MSMRMGAEGLSLAALAGSEDALFRKLWVEDRLRFGADADAGDAFDEATARLVCAAVRARARLVIVLPDALAQRAPLLFATALIRDWVDRISANKIASERDRVLYFGGSVGIRDQLAATVVGGLGREIQLSEVFRQRHVGRSGESAAARGGTATPGAAIPLPEVVTAYAPADIAGVFERENPAWVALDATSRAPWAGAVIEEAARRGLPLVAWTSERLADWLGAMDKVAMVFRWPRRGPGAAVPDRRGARHQPALLLATEPTTVSPLVLAGEHAARVSDHLQHATAVLAQVTGEATSSFYKDAVGVHWQYLRLLETLSVPLALYEAEAGGMWGVRRASELAAGCERFRDAARASSPTLAAALDEAAHALSAAAEMLDEPPLWRAAREIALAGEPGTVLAFASIARRRLFAYALLASANVSEQELAARGVRLAALAELGALAPCPARVVCVALPPASAGDRALALFCAPEMKVLVLPHQSGAVTARTRLWASALGIDPDANAAALRALGAAVDASVFPAGETVRLGGAARVEADGQADADAQDAKGGLGLPVLDAAQELARLFEDPAEDEDDRPAAEDDAGKDGAETAAPAFWCASAIRLRFSGGWTADFAPDDRVTVVLGGGKRGSEERFVRAVRAGDVVLAMPGQRRQSLYALLVSRVHRHPAIQLHLTLVERWHAELEEAIRRLTVSDTGGVYGLLRQIRTRGSSITSVVTVYAWIRGAILCPQDPKDLLRVAEALDMAFTREHYRRIHAAANRIAGLHRSLSHRIGRWMEQQLSGGYGADELVDELDADWGVRFSDFRDSLLLLRTEDAIEVPGPFLRARLGHFTRETNP